MSHFGRRQDPYGLLDYLGCPGEDDRGIVRPGPTQGDLELEAAPGCGLRCHQARVLLAARQFDEFSPFRPPSIFCLTRDRQQRLSMGSQRGHLYSISGDRI